jgi:hypothetical protein
MGLCSHCESQRQVQAPVIAQPTLDLVRRAFLRSGRYGWHYPQVLPVHLQDADSVKVVGMAFLSGQALSMVVLSKLMEKDTSSATFVPWMPQRPSGQFVDPEAQGNDRR